jgi:hypothetical protein
VFGGDENTRSVEWVRAETLLFIDGEFEWMVSDKEFPILQCGQAGRFDDARATLLSQWCIESGDLHIGDDLL